MANINVSSSSGNAMMMMPPRKLLPPVESSFASSSDSGNNNNNINNHNTHGSKIVRPPTTGNIGVSGGGGMGGGGATTTISSKPTLITTPKLRFLIMDAPRQSNLHLYIKECRRHHVTDIVRVCEPTYLGNELQQAGITLHEMAYDDGHSPPEHVLTRWLTLVEERFLSGATNATTHHSTTTASNTKATTIVEESSKGNNNTIAVHCVAGLGRAPVLVAIALMEYEKMDAVEAVMKIRSLRRGAINETQLQYLEGYKCGAGRHHRRGNKMGAKSSAAAAGGGGGGDGGCGCWIL